MKMVKMVILVTMDNATQHISPLAQMDMTCAFIEKCARTSLSMEIPMTLTTIFNIIRSFVDLLPKRKAIPTIEAAALLASIVQHCRDAFGKYGNIVRTIRIISRARKPIVLQRESGSKRWNVEKNWVSLTQYLEHKVILFM